MARTEKVCKRSFEANTEFPVISMLSCSISVCTSQAQQQSAKQSRKLAGCQPDAMQIPISQESSLGERSCAWWKFGFEKRWLVGFDQIESPWIPGIVNGEPKRTRFFSSKRSAVLPHPKMATFLTPRSSISSTWRARKLCFEFECVAFLRGHFRELRRSRVVKRKTFDC